jgi:tRNA threonylcarbamoyladenosine biosynthesis protein TsaB
VILALDTATPSTVVGVAAPDGTVLAARRHDPAPGERPQHTQAALPLAHAALAEAGVAWSDIARLGAGVGPGTFTGIRIGVATVRALAQGLGAETVAISTLEALALGIDGGNVAAVLDARRGEAFVAAWAADGTRILAPAAWRPELLADIPRLAPGPWRATGDGAVRFRAELEAVGVIVAPDDADAHRVAAGPLCRLAAEAPPVPRDALVPEYVRAPDAAPRTRPPAAP